MAEFSHSIRKDRHVSPSFREAFRFWLKLGFISFGGPTGQIAIMHTELVEKKKWISHARFLHALNFCMLLPGPEAQQLAIYIGWLWHRIWGGIVAGALFVLPSIFILWALSYVYVVYGNVPWIAAVFYGLKPGVLAIVAAAVIRIGRKALQNEIMWAIAAAAFVALYFFHVPFPVVIVSAGAVGLVGAKVLPRFFAAALDDVTGSTSTPGLTSESGSAGFQPAAAGIVPDAGPASRQGCRDLRAEMPVLPNIPTFARTAKICAISLLLWWFPVALAGILLGRDHTLFQEGLFFSKAAMVTFGGAYAVLPYVSQMAVENYHWLSAHQMLDGLGLAETTPGPLIMVLQFVGFLGGWNHPGNLPPLLAASSGALMTTWVTFVPCFLWIFLGAPYIEKLRGNKQLTSALSTVTAAVVGVILNLAVWFGIHVLFPAGTNMDWFAAVVCAVAFAGMLRWNWNVVPVVLGSGIAGLIYKSLF